MKNSIHNLVDIILNKYPYFVDSNYYSEFYDDLSKFYVQLKKGQWTKYGYIFKQCAFYTLFFSKGPKSFSPKKLMIIYAYDDNKITYFVNSYKKLLSEEKIKQILQNIQLKEL